MITNKSLEVAREIIPAKGFKSCKEYVDKVEQATVIIDQALQSERDMSAKLAQNLAIACEWLQEQQTTAFKATLDAYAKHKGE